MPRDDALPGDATYRLRDGGQRSVELASADPAVADPVAASLTQDAFDEPLFGDQWHLGSPTGFDINIGNVWDDYTGAGIHVAVIDTGIDPTHPDLDDNIDPINRLNSRTGSHATGSGNPQNGTDNHGTAVAGVIAAEDNDIGVVGVAYGATLVSIYTPLTTSAFALRGLEFAENFDVVNNSWGYGGGGDPFYVDFEDTARRSGEDASFAAYGTAIRNTAEGGRDGLGTIIVFSAGNHFEIGDDVNLSNFTNSRYAITVGATDEAGDPAFFSTPGSALLISAPGVDIATTDRPGSAGFVPNQEPVTLGSSDYVEIDGTSFSAPIISAVSALILQANSGLGARDVQEILAYSARTLNPEDANWQTNGAGNWNGGGLTWSYDFGSGLVDAHAAVRLAESWFLEDVFGLGAATGATFNNEATASGSAAPNLAIPDNSDVGISSIITVAGDVMIDHVEVHLDITHSFVGDLVAELVSPTGMSAILLLQPYLGSASENNVDFTFSSTFFWGEHSAGDWTLNIFDFGPSDTGRLVDWELTAYGDAIAVDDTYYFTNEFGSTFVSEDAARRTLSDSGGNDTINVAAVESASTVNLAAGSAQIAGHTLTIAAGTAIENVIGGDGDDVFSGNDLANMFHGGRGDDTLNGGAGNDLLLGGAGSDFLDGGDDNDTLVGGSGDDVLDGGADQDTADYRSATAGVTVDLGSTIFQSVGADLGQDRLVSIEVLLGSRFDDVLTAAMLGSTLSGRDGDDTLQGADGNDTLLGGEGDDSLDGGGGDDVLFGDEGNEILRGGAGNDTLDGGRGNNVLFGGAGDDLLVMRRDGEFMNGGAGQDLVAVLGRTSVVDLRTAEWSEVEALSYASDEDDIFLLDANSILLANDTSRLRIVGDAGDVLLLDDAWELVACQEIDGATYQIMALGAAVLEVAKYVEVLDGTSWGTPLALNVRTSIDLEEMTSQEGFVFSALLQSDGGSRKQRLSGEQDLNGDGRNDILIRTPEGSMVVFGPSGTGGSAISPADLDGATGFNLPFGSSGTLLGDLDGDGFDDFVWFHDNFAPFLGVTDVAHGAQVLRGGVSPFEATLAIEEHYSAGGAVADFDELNHHLLGSVVVSSAGDINGDGFADFVIGQAFDGPSYFGDASVIFGAEDFFESDQTLADLDGHNGFRVVGSNNYSELGLFVSGAGDINGDGFDDLLIGRAQESYTLNGTLFHFVDEPEVFVVFGAAGGFEAEFAAIDMADDQGIKIGGPGDFDELSALTSAGDFNGDGFDDILIAFGSTVVGQDKTSGDAFVIFGSDEGLPANLDLANLEPANGFQISSSFDSNYLGLLAAGAGDFDGDGYDDIVIGTPNADGGTGAAYVIFGRPDMPTDIVLETMDEAFGIAIHGASGEERIGHLVAGLGDVNGDGLSDIAVQGRAASGTELRTHVIFGVERPTGPYHFDNGDAGSNNLQGGTADDVLFGAGGHDSLNGNIGDDVLIGATGNDVILGDAGRDRLYGGQGNDSLFGGTGNDTLSDGDGNDLLDGGDGDDVLVVRGVLVPSLAEDVSGAKPTGTSVTVTGGAGEDTGTIAAFGLDDTIVVSVTAGGVIEAMDERLNTVTLEDVETIVIELLDGNDTISFGSMAGSDYVRGTVLGGDGDDVLVASDIGPAIGLFGGAGDDTLSGGAGSDVLDGGDGED